MVTSEHIQKLKGEAHRLEQEAEAAGSGLLAIFRRDRVRQLQVQAKSLRMQAAWKADELARQVEEQREVELTRKSREKSIRERLEEDTKTLASSHRASVLATERDRGQDQGMSL